MSGVFLTECWILPNISYLNITVFILHLESKGSFKLLTYFSAKSKCLLLAFLLIICFSTSVFSKNFTLSKIASLSKPWGMSFIGDEEVIVTERTGKIKLINLKNGAVSEVIHNLNYKTIGQGGLLDIIFKDGYIWVSYTQKIGIFRYGTSIAKGKFNRKEINFINIFQQNSANNSGQHFGGRLLIEGKYLFLTVGERGLGRVAQDPKKHPGSIIRIHLDGSIPSDNPHFVSNSDWGPAVFQIGVRNPQGMTISPNDEKIFISNHGAKGGDWIGEIKKGGNFGWNILGWGGVNYDGSQIGPKWKEGFSKPLKYWTPSIGVSALAFYTGPEFTEWNNNILIASLRDKSLRLLSNLNSNIILEEILFSGLIDRIRDIEIDKNTGKIFLLSEKYFSETGPEEDGLWILEKK